MAIGQLYGDQPDVSNQPGVVRIFDRVGAAWVETQTVEASDGEAGDIDRFGFSVAVDGDTLLVGAVEHGLVDTQGAVYVFDRQTSGLWVETQILLPPEFDTWVMGCDVDIEGDRAAIGARGALGSGKGKVFIYERVAGAWTKTATLQPPAPYSVSGDRFGVSLDLQGDRIAVGAEFNFGGKAFTFTYSSVDSQWHHEATLAPGDVALSDSFGRDVALDGSTLIVGSPLHDLPVGNCGALYVFDLVSGAWIQTAKLTASDPTFSLFGHSIEVVGDRLITGAPFSMEPSYTGAAYLFERQGGDWTELAKFGGSNLLDGDTLGWALDMNGAEVAIGAPNVVASTLGPGKVFLYSFAALDGGASLTADATELSLSQGGTQSLAVAGCTEHAGDFYALAGTLSGTAPGFAYEGFSVALNPDPYFFFTLNASSGSPLSAAQGFLDAFGRAEASFALPPGSAAALAGLVAHHAVALLDPASLALEAVSPPVPVALAP